METPIINYNRPQRRAKNAPNCYTYIIRMWEEEGHSHHKIRLTAQDTRTGERKGFTDWEQLVRYLQTAIENKEQITQKL